MSHPILLVRRATALLFAALALIGTVAVSAQTTFALSSTAANYATGVADPNAVGAVPGSGITSTGSSYSSGAGTSLTFGQGFQVLVNGTSGGGGTAAWLFDGTSTGAIISNGTVLPISYEFTLQKNEFIVGDASWALFFDGSSSSSNVQIASGTLSGTAPATFSNFVSYTYDGGAAASATFRAYLEVSFTSNISSGQGAISATMVNGGLGGPGITLNASAIPEPSTYAAIAGAAMLGYVVWSRRRRSAPVA